MSYIAESSSTAANRAASRTNTPSGLIVLSSSDYSIKSGLSAARPNLKIGASARATHHAYLAIMGSLDDIAFSIYGSSSRPCYTEDYYIYANSYGLRRQPIFAFACAEVLGSEKVKLRASPKARKRLAELIAELKGIDDDIDKLNFLDTIRLEVVQLAVADVLGVHDKPKAYLVEQLLNTLSKENFSLPLFKSQLPRQLRESVPVSKLTNLSSKGVLYFWLFKHFPNTCAAAIAANMDKLAELSPTEQRYLILQAHIFIDFATTQTPKWKDPSEVDEVVKQLQAGRALYREQICQRLSNLAQLDEQEEAALLAELKAPYAQTPEIKQARYAQQLHILGMEQEAWPQGRHQRDKLKKRLRALATSSQKSGFHKLVLNKVENRKRAYFKLLRDTRMGKSNIRWPLELPNDDQVAHARFDRRHYSRAVRLAEIPKPESDPETALPKLKTYLQQIEKLLPAEINDEGEVVTKEQFITNFNNHIDLLSAPNVVGKDKGRKVLTHLVEYLDKKSEAKDPDLEAILLEVLVEDIGLAFFHCADRQNSSWDNIYGRFLSPGFAASLNAQEQIQFWIYRKRRALFEEVAKQAINEHAKEIGKSIDVASTLSTYRYTFSQRFGLGPVSQPAHRREYPGLENCIESAFLQAYNPQALVNEIYDLMRQLDSEHLLKLCELAKSCADTPGEFVQKMQAYFAENKEVLQDNPGPVIQQICTLIEEYSAQDADAPSKFLAAVNGLIAELKSMQLPSYSQIKEQWLDAYYPSLSALEMMQLTKTDADEMAFWWSEKTVTLLLQDLKVLLPYTAAQPLVETRQAACEQLHGVLAEICPLFTRIAELNNTFANELGNLDPEQATEDQHREARRLLAAVQKTEQTIVKGIKTAYHQFKKADPQDSSSRPFHRELKQLLDVVTHVEHPSLATRASHLLIAMRKLKRYQFRAPSAFDGL